MFGSRSPCTSFEAALDLLTKHERSAPSAVIGAGAVVVHTTAELREQQHDDVVGMLVLAQIGPERLDAFGDRLPQQAVSRVLPGMRVKGAVVAVEDPTTDVRAVRLCDALQFAGDRVVRVLHRRGVFLRCYLDDILAL